MKNIVGLKCVKCETQLLPPFSSMVFTSDGKEYEVKNDLPPGVIDGKDAVVVHMHKKCKIPGHISGKIKGRNGKMSYARQKCGVRHVDLESASDRLRGMGFSVASSGHRIFMVLPDRVFKQ